MTKTVFLLLLLLSVVTASWSNRRQNFGKPELVEKPTEKKLNLNCGKPHVNGVRAAVDCNPNNDGAAPDPWCDQTCVDTMQKNYYNLMKAFMKNCTAFASYFDPNAVLEQAGVTFTGINAIQKQCEADAITWPQTTVEFVDTTYTSASNETELGVKLYYVSGTAKQGVQNLTHGLYCSGVRNELVRATANEFYKFVNVRIIYDPTLVPCDGPNGTTNLSGSLMSEKYLELMTYWRERDCVTYASYFAVDAKLYDNGVIYHNRAEIQAACVADTQIYPSIGFSWDVNYTNADQGNSIGTRPYGKFGNVDCIAILNQVIVVTFNQDYTVRSLEALFPYEYWIHACTVETQAKAQTVDYFCDTYAFFEIGVGDPTPSRNIWTDAGIDAWEAAAGFADDEAVAQFSAAVGGYPVFVTPFETEAYFYGIIQAANNNFGLTSNPLFFVYARETEQIQTTVNHAKVYQNYQGNPNYRPQLVVRSGGHSMLAFSTANDSIIVDMSNMTQVWFDQEAMEVTAQAGTTFKVFYEALKQWGVHTPGGSCDGVALGGYNGGGGYGITSRMYGMGCYNIKQLTMVMANGSVTTANPSYNPELLWAQCGGGNNNYGIAINMTFNVTQRMPMVWNIEYRWTIDSAQEVIDTFQNYVPFKSDRRLGLYLEFSQYNNTPPTDSPYPTPQPWSYMIAAIGMFWADATDGNPVTLAEAEAAMTPFDSIGGLQFRKYTVETYETSNSDQFDGIEWAMPYTHGDPYWEYKYSSVINRPLNSTEIQLIIDAYVIDHPLYNLTDPSGQTYYCCGSEISFEVYGGSIADGPHWTQGMGGIYETWSHQIGYFDVFASAYFVNLTQQNSTRDWALNFWNTMNKINGSLNGPPVYRNYPVTTELFRGNSYMLPYYQNSAYELQRLKSVYDPTNFFHYDQSIPPLFSGEETEGQCGVGRSGYGCGDK